MPRSSASRTPQLPDHPGPAPVAEHDVGCGGGGGGGGRRGCRGDGSAPPTAARWCVCARRVERFCLLWGGRSLWKPVWATFGPNQARSRSRSLSRDEERKTSDGRCRAATGSPSPSPRGPSIFLYYIHILLLYYYIILVESPTQAQTQKEVSGGARARRGRGGKDGAPPLPPRAAGWTPRPPRGRSSGRGPRPGPRPDGPARDPAPRGRAPWLGGGEVGA